MSPPAAIVDIDGTLVDSNYQHALSWYRAFRAVGVRREVWRLHRLVGVGADQFVERIAGPEVEREHGDEIRAVKDELYVGMRDEIAPIDGALELLEALADGGRRVVLATSATADEAEQYVDLVGAREIVDGWTTAADVERAKPEPDLVRAAVAKAGGTSAVMIGDSIWDCEAATRAGLPTIALLTGGFGRDELLAAGAVAVHETPRALAGLVDRPPLAEPSAAAGGPSAPHPDEPRLLRAYISDHLQLMRAGHDLALRVRRRERGGELGSLLGDVAFELREQQAVAIACLRQLGAGRPWLRLAVGSLAERAGRAKPNGRLRTPSPLAPLSEIGVLQGLLESAARFWRALEHAGAARPEVVLPRADAAERLIEPLEVWRLRRGDGALHAPGGA